jgi:5'-nucleotidase
MNDKKPLILITNDDGFESPGLWAAARAFADIGDVLVVAPRLQQSAMGRSLPRTSKGRIYEKPISINGEHYTGYAVDASPAQAVLHGVLEVADRKPSLVVSGINYGENAGSGITVSGTVGAALEAANMGIPALAISQQTTIDLHLSYSNSVDFGAAAYFARHFGEWLIQRKPLPYDVDLLKVDVPLDATIETPWRVTRISRRRLYVPVRPQRVDVTEDCYIGYEYEADLSQVEPDSDVYALFHDRVVSVTPISLDITSRVNLADFAETLATESLAAD